MFRTVPQAHFCSGNGLDVERFHQRQYSPLTWPSWYLVGRTSARKNRITLSHKFVAMRQSIMPPRGSSPSRFSLLTRGCIFEGTPLCELVRIDVNTTSTIEQAENRRTRDLMGSRYQCVAFITSHLDQSRLTLLRIRPLVLGHLARLARVMVILLHKQFVSTPPRYRPDRTGYP